MGLLSRLFGKGTSRAETPGGGSASLAASLMQQNEALAPGNCDVCGATYLSAEAQVVIMAATTPFMKLDIGGYCPRCHKAYCPRHLAYQHTVATHMPDAEKYRDTTWGVVCEKCGTPVRHDRHTAASRFITIIALEAKDLEPPRAKPSAEFAAASGKFSLHKMISAMLKPSDPDLDTVPSMICTKCFTMHPHPIPARLFGIGDLRKGGHDLRVEDFEIDIGGTCPTCGVLCGRHATLKEITVQGGPALALYCATHNEQLT